MRVHWFGPAVEPWDPVSAAAWEWTRSRVSDLARSHTVTLWMHRLPTGIPVPGVAVRCYPSDRQWRDLNDGDLTVYELSDDPRLHLGAWGTMRVHRGIAVLRSRGVHPLLFEECRLTDRPAAYLSEMARWHGHVGRLAARRAIADPKVRSRVAHRFPLLDLVADLSLGIVVGDRELFRVAQDRWSCPLAWLVENRRHERGPAASWAQRFELFARVVLDHQVATSLASSLSRCIDFPSPNLVHALVGPPVPGGRSGEQR